MKTQKKAHQVSVRVVILLAMLCILTFFCSATIYVHAAPVSSKSDISEASGSSKGEVQDPDSPQDFQFNITSNAGSSSLSASMKMILVLTLLSLAPFLLYGNFLFKNYCRSSFCPFGIGNADFTT